MIVASVLAEAKVGCLSLSRHPPPAPPGETLDILVIFVSLCLLLLFLLFLLLHLFLLHVPDDDDSWSFSPAQTLFMELVKALIDGAAKKGLMMTASKELLHLHKINTGHMKHKSTHT